MSWKATVVQAYARCFDLGLRAFGHATRQAVFKQFADRIDDEVAVRTNHSSIRFHTPNSLTRWRAESLLTKEPETLAWIDTFDSGDVFWDIGANIGCYSLYAAKRGIRTLAFEPASVNYQLLNRNIMLNDLNELVAAYCLALSDCTSSGLLNMTTFELGGAMSTFGLEQGSVTAGEMTRDVIFRQGMIGMSIDTVLSDLDIPAPTHIKIDVDGIEDKIIAGARQTLKSEPVKSIQIEMDLDDKENLKRMEDVLFEAGFKMTSQRHSAMFDDGPFSSVYNCVYSRA